MKMWHFSWHYCDFNYNRVKNKLLPRIRTFREITFFMLCVTRNFKSNFERLRLVIYYELRD
jgi:hypothetical protein